MEAKPLASRRLGRASVEVVVGSLADERGVDAVVNPTTASMSVAGGVGAALAAKADGKALSKACAALAPLGMAEAVVTPGFGLPSPNIVHCRGPRHGDEWAAETLGQTYWSVLSLAEKSGFSSIAVPAVSSGAMGFPLVESARIAVEALKEFSPDFQSLRRIRFVLVDPGAARVYANELIRPPSLPEKRVRLEISAEYSPEEFEAMRQGLHGDHDTKWFLFFEEPWLCIYRGNRRYGRCHFWLRLPGGSRAAIFEEVFMDAEVPSPEAPWEKEAAEKLIGYLLDDRFGLLWLSGEKEAVGGARYWIKRGKVALEASPGEEEGLLSAEQVRELGGRLIALADFLGRSRKNEL